MQQSKKITILDKIWQRLEKLPQPETEDSLIFRILVQLLVIVGIIATDVAAQTTMTVWAIPLSIAGSTWSWYRRKYRNVTTKFLIAIGMLLTLPVFFGNIFANLNDTRLVLAELLVQLQVLHSFDLPRRKDLGYSMVIGLILIGVAGTVSQTLTFAPWLILFLLIALPVLVLDYRSRLGLESIENIWLNYKSNTQKKQRSNLLKYSPISPKNLTIFFLIILVFGLIIFAIMPRFPGYQLQSFPVSSPSNLANQNFNNENRGIVNPGYVKEGEGTGSGGGNNQEEGAGAGEVDSTFYYGFNNKMNQNLRGEMKRKLVLRIRSQAAGFWKVMSFDHYTGQGWEVSREDQLQYIERRPWSYQFFLGYPAIKLPTKRIIQTYTAVSELPNIIPSLSYPQNVYFPTPEIGIDAEGSLRSPTGLLEGLTYTVVSQVPYRDRSLIGTASENYADKIINYYLQIPENIREKVKNKTEELLAKSEKPLTSTYEKTLFLAQAVKQNYTIQPNLPFLEKNEDLVEAFMFKYAGGYPDHFASTLTVMLRSIGIPSRLTVGFAPGQFNPFTGYYLVHNTDAYALTEVYFPEFGWFTFDPIPGHEIIPPSIEEENTFGVLGQFWRWVAGWLPSPVSSFVANLWMVVTGFLFGIIGWLWGLFSGGVLGIFAGLIFLTSVGFLLWLGFNQLSKLSYRRRLAKLPPMARLYQQMLLILKEKGYSKNPAQTPLEYAKNFHEDYNEARAEIIEEISQAYVSWLYGNYPQNIPYLQQQLSALKRSFKKLKSKQKSSLTN
jgi:transglutaminase-like putative cysteine protease